MRNDNQEEKKCYVWTRVSTKYQEDNGGSLDNQRCKCEIYAREYGYTIVDYFGGTHESAKTPGKLINEMVSAVKRNHTITHIIVTEADRFSRNAGQGATILNDLMGLGVVVVEAITGLDTATPAGLLMIQMKVCMSQWDNTNRVDKFVSGRKHCMEIGVFTGHSPEGYDKHGKSINTTYTINDTGRLIRKAFKWKLQGVSSKEIMNRLANYGYIVTKQHLHKIFTNPFYAGKIVNKMLNYEVIDGKHPALISYEDYLRVQDLLSGRTGKYVHQKETPKFPLKRHVRCAIDDTPFTAYSVKKKRKDYYKCNKIGCKTNVSAQVMHDKYCELLNSFRIPTTLLAIVKKVVSDKINGDNEELNEAMSKLKKSKTEIENKIKTNKLRFADGVIDEDVFQIALAENQRKLDNILLEIDKVKKELSNSDSDVDSIVAMCCRLGDLWEKSSLQTCKKIQNLVFPNGILWDKKISNYRTIKTNEAIAVIAKITNTYKKKNEDEKSSSVNSCG